MATAYAYDEVYLEPYKGSSVICFTGTDWDDVDNKPGTLIADLPLNYANSSSLKEEIEEWLAL